MTKIIWKFPLLDAHRQAITMPCGAKIIGVQVLEYGDQGIVLYAITNKPNDEETVEKRIIEIIGTGHPIDDKARNYIGSVQKYRGALAWHVFEVEAQRSDR